MKFNENYEEWIKSLSVKFKPTTILWCERKFNKHILPFFKEKDIYKITDIDYLNWQKYIVGLNYSDSFNNHVYLVFRSYYDFLCSLYHVKNFPRKYGKIKSFKIIPVKELNIWSMKEFKKFIKNVDDQVFHALFNTLFFTGIRKGELLSLKFSDIQKNYININKTITKEYFDGKRLIMQPKTKKSIRKICIDHKLSKELLKLKNYYKKKYYNFDDNFFVFGGVKPISTTTLDRKKNYYCDLAKVKRIRIHDFRHSHATILYDNKIKVKYIQERLGHADVSTTLNTYVHSTNKDEKRVIRTLNFLRLR